MASRLPLVRIAAPAAPKKITRNRGRLCMIRCDQCREDKQKCLPVGRTWPTKCERCEKRGLACSEGKQVQRKQRTRRQDADTATRPPTLTNVPRPSSDFRSPSMAQSEGILEASLQSAIEEWILLILYRKNIKMALHRLKRLVEDQKYLFPNINCDKKLSSPLVYFEDSCEYLDQAVSEANHRLFRSFSESHEAAVRLLLPRQILDFAQGEKLCCHICKAEDGIDIFKMHPVAHGDYPAAQHLLTLQTLADSLRVCSLHHTLADSEVRPALNTLYQCLIEKPVIDGRFKDLLIEFNVWNALPDVALSCPLFFPDEILDMVLHGWDFPFPEVLEDRADCLGRTRFHQLLDLRRRRHGQEKLEERLSEIEMKILDSEKELDLEKPDILGRTVLHVSCQNGYTAITKSLLKKGANPRATTKVGLAAFHFAAASGSLAICRELSSLKERNLIARDRYGSTAMDYAIDNDHLEVARLIQSAIQADFYKYLKDPEACTPLLFSAIRRRNSSLVRRLLESGSDANERWGGETPLLLACSVLSSKVNIAKILLAYGANVNANEPHEDTPLHMLVRRDDPEGIKYLITETDADIYALDIFERTPLMLACMHGRDTVVGVFLKHTSLEYIEWRNRKGGDAADWAREYGNWSVHRQLKQRIAQLTINS